MPVRAPSALASALDAALQEGKNEAISQRCRERSRSFDAASSVRGYTQVFTSVVRGAERPSWQATLEA